MTQPPDLLTEWKRLILPPEGIPVRAGEQLKTGNAYPNADRIDWGAHLRGQRTYAVNLAWTDPQGGALCKAAVLDIDEGPESLTKAAALLAVAKAGGLSCLPAWSGSKGCHVWLFFDPAPVPLVRAVLDRLRAAVAYQGETIPGENARVKLAPARHQVRGLWALWLDTLPETPPELENAPTGFLEAQAAILSRVVPSPVGVLERFARTNATQTQRPRAAETAMEPDLATLDGALPPCVAALLDHGAQSALGTWDKNALTLARYCAAAGIPEDGALAMVKTVSDNTGPDFETTKDAAARLKHWASIHDPGPFGCGFILPAKRALGFDCGQCAARPAGVRAAGRKDDRKADRGPAPKPSTGTTTETEALVLEPALADTLLALALQTGQPPARIDPRIFPASPVPDTDNGKGQPRKAPLHRLGWLALAAGYSTPAAMLNWFDRQPEPPDAPTCAALAALVTRLEGLSLPDEPETAALLARAADLSARLALLDALALGRQATEDRRPIADVLGTLQTAATRLQQDAGETWGAPLTAYAAELLDGLVQTDRPTIATPFDTLNGLLGGGFQGGKLYVLAAPPGGGKTTLSTQIADHAAAARIPACYCALEMGMAQLFDYALSRRLGMNSAKVEARSYRHSDHDRAALAKGAREYLEAVAPWLTVLEGGWDTTAARLGAWVAQARARYALADKAPVLVVVDYLQLLNTGDDKLDSGPNETAKISTVAVQLKQLARDTGAAVLALSDIVKSEQGAAIRTGAEFTLNMLRGSNRIAHAADVVLALYSEASQADGGKAALDPWEMLSDKLKDSPRAGAFRRALDDLAHAHPPGGPAAAVHSRLELLKNRGGRGRGSQVLLYERAYHRFVGLSLPGQDEAEGRGA